MKGISSKRKIVIGLTLCMFGLPVSCIELYCDRFPEARVCGTGLRAADQSIEALLQEADIEGENAGGTEVDSEADEYAVRYFNRIGDLSWLSWGLQVEKTDVADVAGDGQSVIGLLRFEGGPPLFGVHASGGFGFQFTDVEVIEREVVTESVSVADSHGNHTTITETETTSMVEQTEQETGGIWHVEAGLRGAFTETDRMGWLVSCGASGPTGDGFLAEQVRGCGFALTIAVERGGS